MREGPPHLKQRNARHAPDSDRQDTKAQSNALERPIEHVAEATASCNVLP